MNGIYIEEILAMPTDLIIHKDYIVILDIKAERFLHVFSQGNFNFLGSLIRRGFGPHEEMQIAPYFMNHDNNLILFQSIDAIKTVSVNFKNDSLYLLPEGIYLLPDEFFNDTGIFKINDFVYSSISFREAIKDFFAYNIHTNESIQWGEKLPLTDGRMVPLISLHAINQKFATYNMEKEMLACVFNVLPILRIYSMNNQKLSKELYTSDFSLNEEILLYDKDQLRQGDLMSYYTRVKSTNDFIYALYSGVPSSEYFIKSESGMPSILDTSQEIHIWNWDGTPVMVLKLDRPIFSFDITPDNSQIIATSIVDVDQLFAADIPWN